MSLLSVGAYGGMFARRWWRNRYRIVPAQVIGAIEAGDTPVLLDVRNLTTRFFTGAGVVRAVADPDNVEAREKAMRIACA